MGQETPPEDQLRSADDEVEHVGIRCTVGCVPHKRKVLFPQLPSSKEREFLKGRVRSPGVGMRPLRA